MSNGSLGKAIKNGTDIQTKYLDNIIKEFPDLNPTWLLTGEGDMLLPPTANEPEPQYTKGSSSTENLVQILASPSQTGREQILKEEVLRLKQTLEEIRELHDKGHYGYPKGFASKIRSLITHYFSTTRNKSSASSASSIST